MFYPTTKAMLDLANSLKALKAYQGLVSFPDLRPRPSPFQAGNPPVWGEGEA